MLPLLSERKRFLDSFHEYVISGACVGGDFDKFGGVCLQGELSLTVQLIFGGKIITYVTDYISSLVRTYRLLIGQKSF